MNRRHLLKGMGAAAAASLWPGWLSEAFAGEPCGVLKGTVTLGAAIQRAHAALRPLLVLVIPKEDSLKWDRGSHLGEWLNHGAPEDLAPLACAEVVCAEMDAVRQLLPSAPRDAEPAMLVVDVDRAPARLAVALPDFNHRETTYEDIFSMKADPSLTEQQRMDAYVAHREQLARREDADISACIARTGAAVRQAIFGDAAALRARADARWERMTAGERDTARKLLAGGDDVPPEEVMAVAPVLATKVTEASGDPRLLQVLAAAARARYGRQRIPGSKWAHREGCGEIVEEENENIAFGCGMGHVPRRSQRFLYFFTRPSFGATE